jgi:tRNA (cmo5U34)-methyltransferase
MTMNSPINLWDSPDHARDYLRRADSLAHRTEGESTLLEFLPKTVHRVLDLGTGDGRLLALVKTALAARETDGERHGKLEAVAVDFSPAMLEAARVRFAKDPSVTVVTHNLDNPLPSLGNFDAVVSCFAIHHLLHERKHALYAEIYAVLNPGGVFCNLEHVASPTSRLHEEFLLSIGHANDDPSNKLLDLETQLGWLRKIGFVDVDCHWKWRELALMMGRKT